MAVYLPTDWRPAESSLMTDVSNVLLACADIPVGDTWPLELRSILPEDDLGFVAGTWATLGGRFRASTMICPSLSKAALLSSPRATPSTVIRGNAIVLYSLA